jgi:nucleosome assembly protein 1-like 1
VIVPLEQVQVGLALKDEVIPFAVKYYTGEVNDDDDGDAEDWEDVDDGNDDDGSGDDDDDVDDE